VVPMECRGDVLSGEKSRVECRGEAPSVCGVLRRSPASGDWGVEQKDTGTRTLSRLEQNVRLLSLLDPPHDYSITTARRPSEQESSPAVDDGSLVTVSRW